MNSSARIIRSAPNGRGEKTHTITPAGRLLADWIGTIAVAVMYITTLYLAYIG